MKRSFGGRGMGGGSGGGGGGIIRTVQRAVRAGVGGAPPEPFSPSPNSTTTIASSANSRKTKNFNSKQPTSPNAALALSASSSSSSSANGGSNYNGTSSFSSLINLPASATSGAPAAPSSFVCSDESEWECVDDGSEDERARAFHQDFVFGTVPSTDEVHHAVSALQQVLESSYKPFPEGKISEDIIDEVVADEDANARIGPERIISSMDWIEPSSYPYNSKIVRPRGSDRVYDAFHLLQNDPSVQRMVISLSSDRAVWDAVLNNEVVKELTGSTHPADTTTLEEGPDEGPDGSNSVKDMLSWIVVNCKAKIMQLIDKMAMFVNEFVQVPNEEKKGDGAIPLDEKLKTCVLLSIAVLFIVVITRAQGA